MATDRSTDGQAFLGRAPRAVSGPSAADLDHSATICSALRDLVTKEDLDVLTIRCFDLVLGDRATGCLALARLNDEGIPAGCEGDIPSALGLLWTRFLTGRPGWMANPARVDVDQGHVLLAHCTVPVSMVTHFDLRTHFESGLGAAIQGEFAPGAVTLLRIGGRALDQVRVIEGEVVATHAEPGYCRTQVTVSTDPAWLTELLNRPLGNHLLLLPGRHARMLQASASMILRS